MGQQKQFDKPLRTRSGGQKMSGARARRLQRATGSTTPTDRSPSRKEAPIDLLDLSSDRDNSTTPSKTTTSKNENMNSSESWALDFVSAGRPASNAFEEDSKSAPFFENDNDNNPKASTRGGSRSKNSNTTRTKTAPAATPAMDEDLFQSKRKSNDNIMAMYNTNPMNQMQMNHMNMNPSQQMLSNSSNFNQNGANEK